MTKFLFGSMVFFVGGIIGAFMTTLAGSVLMRYAVPRGACALDSPCASAFVGLIFLAFMGFGLLFVILLTNSPKEH
jgi:hypothetical protein